MEKAYIRRYNIMHMIHRTIKPFQHKNTTTHATLTLNLDLFQKLLHATRTSLTLNTDLNPILMKTHMIKSNWSTKVLTTKQLIKLNVTT